MIRVTATPIERNTGEKRCDAEKRAVLRCLRALGVDEQPHHHSSGAPFLPSAANTVISVTHSAHWAAVALANRSDGPVGIDVEDSTRPQLPKLSAKFLSDNESSAAGNVADGLTKAWTAKEAVYKAALKRGVVFKHDIALGDGFETALFRPDCTLFKLSFLSLSHNNILCIASTSNIFEFNTL